LNAALDDRVACCGKSHDIFSFLYKFYF
jgi:hypothetical protein